MARVFSGGTQHLLESLHTPVMAMSVPLVGSYPGIKKLLAASRRYAYDIPPEGNVSSAQPGSPLHQVLRKCGVFLGTTQNRRKAAGES
jgi:hypothetical protein